MRLLDPALAAGSATDVISGTLTAKVQCADLGPGQTAEVTVQSGVLTWKGSAASPGWDEGGWLIYQIPEGGAPYGVAESQKLLWATDPGRQKLLRLSLGAKWAVYLPLISRVAGP